MFLIFFSFHFFFWRGENWRERERGKRAAFWGSEILPFPLFLFFLCDAFVSLPVIEL